ncbi:MAG: C1 family peptidase [Treponema sp.]|jgi:bleomycin hydrolase|nr:C1 family peptidase [Treponema sp.]
MNQDISIEKCGSLRKAFLGSRENILRMNSVTKSGIDGAALAYQGQVNTPNVFSYELKTGEITAQNASGRCWLFAAANLMRLEVMRKCELDDFEISQAYLFFWDKFERANFFLNSILDTLDEPQDSRLLAWLLGTSFSDGGQWDMVMALVEKHGVVPKTVMPESFHSGASQRINKFLTLKAREYARDLREARKAGLSREALFAKKDAMLETIYRMLCIAFGVPPERFDFECRGREGKEEGEAGGQSVNRGRFTRDLNITPLEFYHNYVGRKFENYVSLINSPTADKAFYDTFTVAYLGNVAGGRPVHYLNLPVENLKRAALAQLTSGEAVWFGTDVHQMLDVEHGLMGMDTYDFENLFGTPFPLDKASRLDYGESLMTHAMVFTGVNVVDGKPNRWKVENSWGDKRGEKGWFRMSDDWFSEYVYQVVVDKKYLTGEELKALEKKPVVLKPWDPMGSLA